MRLRCVALAAVVLLLAAEGSTGRTAPTGAAQAQTDSIPIVWARHTAGRLGLAISNRGDFGYRAFAPPVWEYITGELIMHAAEFPLGSGRDCLHGAGISVGGIIGGDTLVTTTWGTGVWEMQPIPVNGAWFDYCRAIDPPSECRSTMVSDEDFRVAFTDTAITDDINWYDYLDRRPHKPLHIEITEETYVWSYRYAAEIVFFHLELRNIGQQPIRNAYVGITVNTGHISGTEDSVGFGNVVGYLQEAPSGSPCDLLDTVNLAWAANRDGYPVNGGWAATSPRDIMGIRFLESAIQPRYYSFNWWAWEYYEWWDYGPMRQDNYRNLRTGQGYTGWPGGDRNEYYVMSKGEIDFDSPFTGVMPDHSGWLLPPPDLAERLASHGFPWFEVATGPYGLNPGAMATVDFCVVAGDTFHVDPTNGANLPHHPRTWYKNVNFSNLARNAVWAQRIYDNPGVDTDGDGYFGESRVCVLDSALVEGQWVPMVADTEWYKGDGVPDWRAATPPIAPTVWVEPIKNGLHVRFNGEVSETAKDVLTETVDFEGYRVYIGRDERKESFSLVASYDRDNYDKWVFDSLTGEWAVHEDPFTLEQLRCLYGSGGNPCLDSSFVPSAYSDRGHYFQPEGFPDSIFFFTPHDRNASGVGQLTSITRTYPDMPDPRTLEPDELTPELYTEDGYLKYFEYQLDLTDLLPTVPYYVSVTTFDFGSPSAGVAPLETEVTERPVEAFPIHELDQPVSGSDQIYVYPNPYRLDVDYREIGIEGRNQDDRWDERVRVIWFANLPPKCTIHLFTIDGDRVRTMEHNVPATDATSRRHQWDLINRNYQRVQTGLYYWVVEIPGGKSQVGKLAIIR